MSDDVERVIYVGKGQANRCFDHLRSAAQDEKTKAISKIHASGNLRIDILVYGLEEKTALKVEAATIDLLGMAGLLNLRRGHESTEFGRMTTDDLIAKLGTPDGIDAKDFDEDCILIRINNSFRSGMPSLDLYEATRGVWRASMTSCEKVRFALAVCDGIVREVYLVAGWFSGGSTAYSTRTVEESWMERVEFVGRVAGEDDRKKFLHKDVSQLWSNGAQNPIAYFGPSFPHRSSS